MHKLLKICATIWQSIASKATKSQTPSKTSSGKTTSITLANTIDSLAEDKSWMESLSDKDIYMIADSLKALSKSLTDYSIERDPEAIDQSGFITHVCFNCGSNIFMVKATFDDYEMGLLWPEGICTGCDSTVTIPTPMDHPNWNPDIKEIMAPLPPVDFEDEE